jgi:hypothetical protein
VALLIGAFIPDLAWIAFARIGIEPAQASNFFDDWSHSLVSVAILATLFASAFLRRANQFLSRFGWPCSRTSCSISGSPEAACPRAFERSLCGMGPVGVGFTTRMAWCNQRLVVAISGSVGVASGLCDRGAQDRSSADSRCWALCAAHRNSVADTLSMHRLLNQRFPSSSYR